MEIWIKTNIDRSSAYKDSSLDRSYKKHARHKPPDMDKIPLSNIKIEYNVVPFITQ
jgi:hypothetical protein